MLYIQCLDGAALRNTIKMFVVVGVINIIVLYKLRVIIFFELRATTKTLHIAYLFRVKSHNENVAHCVFHICAPSGGMTDWECCEDGDTSGTPRR
jgi:hypothetical protein